MKEILKIGDHKLIVSWTIPEEPEESEYSMSSLMIHSDEILDQNDLFLDYKEKSDFFVKNRAIILLAIAEMCAKKSMEKPIESKGATA